MCSHNLLINFDLLHLNYRDSIQCYRNTGMNNNIMISSLVQSVGKYFRSNNQSISSYHDF